MGLFRLAAVAALGIALLPADREQQTALYERAATTTKWVVTFCDRNAFTCEQSASLWDQFVKKAHFAAQLAYDVIQENSARDLSTEADGRSRSAIPQSEILRGEASYQPTSGTVQQRVRALDGSRAGTLRPEDLAPQWRGRLATADVR